MSRYKDGLLTVRIKIHQKRKVGRKFRCTNDEQDKT